jgi:carbamoyltransferase
MHGATGDSGTAIGSALLAYAEATGRMPASAPGQVIYTGREYAVDEILDALRSTDGIHWRSDDTVARAAQALAEGHIVGWFQGRSEFGPRALGNRSILADPGRPGMKDRINRVIKHRETFRPFAPSILLEHQTELIDSAAPSWYMCLNGQVLPAARERLAAATHVDHSARYQSVTRDSNPRYHELIERFSALTGTPALLNTSFNDSEPIVESPSDALASFLRTELDCLVVGDYFVTKGAANSTRR